MSKRHSLVVTGLTIIGIASMGVAVGVHDNSQSNGPEAPMVAHPDTTGAAIWAHIQEENYSEDWSLWPGTERFYQGNPPHGMLLTTYVNDVARRALEGGQTIMPEGAGVIKENHTPDRTLAAVTVMYKRDGYNAEYNDWFFRKHLTSGELDKMPNGMAMEGRLPGCQNCHVAVKSKDYLFTARP